MGSLVWANFNKLPVSGSLVFPSLNLKELSRPSYWVGFPWSIMNARFFVPLSSVGSSFPLQTKRDSSLPPGYFPPSKFLILYFSKYHQFIRILQKICRLFKYFKKIFFCQKTLIFGREGVFTKYCHFILYNYQIYYNLG